MDYIQEKTGDKKLTRLALEIIRRESRGKPTAKNPRSSAFGLCQIINGTWDAYALKDEKRKDPFDQIDVCLRILDGGKGIGHWKASGSYYGFI